MPQWLQVVATVNPLSYMVDGLRSLLLSNSLTQLPLDIGVLVVITFLISLLSAYMYPKIVV